MESHTACLAEFFRSYADGDVAAFLNVDRVEARDHEMEDEESEKIGRAGEHEDGGVAAGGIFEHADEDLEDGTAHRASKRANADDGADRLSREHVGRERVEVGGEGLVGGGGYADQQHGDQG